MDKLFGLFVFLNFVGVGVYFGVRPRGPTIRASLGVFVFYIVMYVVLGTYLSGNVAFLRPE